jgi:hypothetical protein
MSHVLVVQPRKILQHAITVALFPDHEARIVEAVPESALAQECDAAIVDALALREINALSAETLSAVSGWTVPIVWIDGDVPQTPKCANLAVLKRPVSRDELRAALATCLGRQLTSRASADDAPRRNAPGGGRMVGVKGALAPVSNPPVIELVDVVEEQAPAQTKVKK